MTESVSSKPDKTEAAKRIAEIEKHVKEHAKEQAQTRIDEINERAVIAKSRYHFPTFTTYVMDDPYGNRLKWGGIEARIWKHVQECEAAGTNYVVLVPIDHGKTTVFVIALRLWKIGRDQDTRRKIISAADGEATARVQTVKQYIENNERYRKVFGPDRDDGETAVTPDYSTDWSDHRITVKRPVPSPDATLESWGITGKGLGGSCEDLVGDDIVDEGERYSAAARNATKRAFKGKWLSRMRKGAICGLVGTPWAPDDALAEAAENTEFSLLKIAIKQDWSGYSVEKDSEKEPDLPFDEHRPKEYLQKKGRILGPTLAQVCLHLDSRPTEGKKFNPEDFGYFDIGDIDVKELSMTTLYMDPAGGQNPAAEKKGDNDFACIVVGGRNPKTKSEDCPHGTLDVIDLYMSNKDMPTAQSKKVVALADLYQLGKVYMESNTCKNWGDSEIRRLQTRRFTVRPVQTTTNTGPKMQRILRLEGPLSRGEIRFARHLLARCPEFFAQFAAWPSGHDDGPDALEGLLRQHEKQERYYIA